MRLRRSIIVVFVGLLAVSPFGWATTCAQTAGSDPGPRYPLPTYEENWEFLRDPTRRGDALDVIKFVPLGENASTFLSLGGEARETYERYGNQDFGLSTPSPKGYVLQRYLLHTDIRVGHRLRVCGELNSSLEGGRVGGPRPVIDEDQFQRI